MYRECDTEGKGLTLTTQDQTGSFYLNIHSEPSGPNDTAPHGSELTGSDEPTPKYRAVCGHGVPAVRRSHMWTQRGKQEHIYRL